MAPAKMRQPIDPVYTDGDWSQDFRFYTDKSLETEEDWSGAGAAIAFVPKAKSLRVAHSFELTSADGRLVMLDNGVGIRLAAGEEGTGALYPADYEFSIRKLDGDDIDVVLVGPVSIIQGLSEVVEGEAPTGPPSSGATGGTVQVVRADNSVHIVRGGTGPRGPAGPADATDVSFDDTLADLGATDVQAAIEQLQHWLIAPQLDFSDLRNSGYTPVILEQLQ